MVTLCSLAITALNDVLLLISSCVLSVVTDPAVISYGDTCSNYILAADSSSAGKSIKLSSYLSIDRCDRGLFSDPDNV